MKKVIYTFLVVIVSLGLTSCGRVSSISYEETADAFEDMRDAAEQEIGQHEDQAQENAKKEANAVGERASAEYDEALDRFSDNSQGTGMTASELLWYYWYMFYYSLKEYMWYILFACWGLGLGLFYFAKGNPGLQKFGLFSLVIGGTIIVLLLSYGPAIQKLFS